ncbi:MAG TPA: zinc-binding dehydrogenase [Chitinophaga sp.]|uniref:quinone oxidoreductase family protein n=1 Tax=Chitinophaga sp. TaxID=1869181 RepID=UPI002BB3FDAD|nr:zinc-binding dehydrogenase [Chitinophaga sp.]HVI43921.1 zinc-binding dehydrogenase [Chitinophaga sp.]
MKAIVFDRIGDPREVLHLAEIPVPPVGDNEVLVKMLAASVNPGDFLFIQNLYPEPKKPVFPRQIGGNHGVGIVERTGRNVSLRQGTLVAFSYYNTWAEYAVIPAEWLIELPSYFPVETAAQFVNVITAWDLLQDSQVQPGEWLALTAGYSAVSKITALFAKHRGIPVIAVVRRANGEVPPGVTAVIDLSQQRDVREQIMEITGNKGVSGIIDNVGGPLTAALIRSTAFGARLIINGGMSEEKYELHNFDILMKGLQIRSHVYRYFFAPPQSGDDAMLQEMIDISAAPDFRMPAGRTYPLDDFRLAIDDSITRASGGKHLFVMPS